MINETTAQPNTSFDDLSDEALMALLAGGQSEALVPLHSRYAALVFNITARSLDRAAAEEIVQDVFVTAWRKAAAFDPERGAVRPWLLQIAHSRVLNELRRRDRRPQTLPDPDGARLAAIADEGPTPEDEAWSDFRRDAVREAVASLPDAQRQALSLAFFEDLTHQQIAQFLGLPLGTAKTRIRDGARKLRGPLAALVAGGLALLVGLGLVANRYLDQRNTFNENRDALGVATSSDVQELHLAPAAGLPANAHGAYRVRPAGGLAILTVSFLPQAPQGKSYRAWIQVNGTWIDLGPLKLDADGHALLIVDREGLGIPDAIEVTLEANQPGAAPDSSIIVSWAKS